MPKLILRCNYLKNSPSAHLSNFINYISTREGVEKVDSTTGQFPATAKQKELIEDILQRIEDAGKMHEYYDYLQKPTRENATEFITQALEYNLDTTAKKKNYMDYLANRPGVEKIGSHGLFSVEGEAVILAKVQEEVATHKGIIWTNVISLRREDAERLGYDRADQWQALIRSRMQLLAENYKIDSSHLKWYAAFHNESHHPHIHLVVYSTNPSEGFLTKTGIENMRSAFAHDIFRQDFMSIYQRKTEQRNILKEQAEVSLLFLMEQMKNCVCQNDRIEEKMQLLSERLKKTSGKKVYGYLKADVKAIVNEIVDELGKEGIVAECYQKWIDCQNEVLKTYKDTIPDVIPLSEQKELKSIKNMVIRHALNLGQDIFYADEEGQQEHENAETDMFIEQLLNQDIAEQGGDEDQVQDDEQSFLLFQKVHRLGNAYAEYRLGTVYLSEEYFDISKAVYYLTLAANHDNKDAAYRLGMMYLKGVSGTEDFQKEKAKAKQQSKDLLLDKNIESACFYLTKSAEAGNQFAQYALGKLYMTGKEVNQDKEKALVYIKASAEQGNIYAQYFLNHWGEIGNPDISLMATRLLHQLEQLFEEQMAARRGGRGITESKLRRRIREKKIAQGHAREEQETMQQSL